MEDEIKSAETQEVAEPAISVETVEVAEQPQVVEQLQENVEQESSERNKERDRAFAEMRRELEKANQENSRYKETLQRYGFKGSNSDEIIDDANAQYFGKTVEEVRKQRLLQEEEKRKQTEIKERLERYEMKEIEETMQKDLSEIQKINSNVKSLDDLGEPFFDLIRKGIDGVKAYKLLELDGLIKKDETKAEQLALKKLKANASASVGATDKEPSKPKTIDDLSDEEFEALRQRALRGELKSK